MLNTPLTEETAKNLIESLNSTRDKISSLIQTVNSLNINIPKVSEKIKNLEKKL